MAAPDWTRTDFYAVLGVNPDASAAEITSAYRHAARASHPDVQADGADTTDRFVAVIAAYEVIGDDVTRREYDLFRRVGPREFERVDVLSSGVRGYVYAPPSEGSPDEGTSSTPWFARRHWVLAGVMVAVAVVLVTIALVGGGGEELVEPPPPSSMASPSIGEATESAESLGYSFSDIDCSPGGWSGVFTNGSLEPFEGTLSAVAVTGDRVMARSRVSATVPAGGQELIQFNWEGGTAPPPGSECRLESVQHA